MKSELVKGLFSLLSPDGQKWKLTVLLFHKIPQIADPLTPTELDVRQFEKILNFVEENLRVVSLGDATAALAKGKALPSRAVALTFDDGYAEWVDGVAPALRRRNLPATFFVTTGQLSGAPLWHERIISAVRALPDHNISLPYGFGSYCDLSGLAARIRLVTELQDRLKYVPLQERLDAIELLEAQAVHTLILPKSFNESSVRELHNQGFDIGGHTIQHPILNECTDTDAMIEIGGCREELETIIGGTVGLFAYPNGRPQKDFRGDHVKMVKKCGYKAAVATNAGVATKSTDVYQLPRFTPWGESDDRIAYQLARNILTSPNPRTMPDDETNQIPVKCLLVASTFPPIHGGSAVVFENLCAHMPADSVRVLTAKKNYLTNRFVDGWQQHDQTLNFPISRINLLRPLMMPAPANLLASLYRFIFKDVPLYCRVFFSAALIVYKHRINIICVGELVTGTWLGLVLRKLFGCKLVVYVFGEEITTVTGGRVHGNRRKYYLKAADKIVAISSFTCDALTREMGLRPTDVTLIQTGVDTHRFKPAAPDPAILARHNLHGKKILLTVGRLVSRKGIDMAIRAMAKVIRERQDIHYLIVGDGECRTELSKIIDEENISNHVTLVGKVADDDLVRYFQTCDIFLMPNRTLPDGDTEGFGLVFREANACGKPVIGGRAGGAVEAVADGETGFLVDGTNPDKIATAIRTLLSDSTLAAEMSLKGLKLAQDNNVEAVSRQFLTTCERLLRDGANEKFG